jgi:uncharacterized protein (TIGR02452 family)
MQVAVRERHISPKLVIERFIERIRCVLAVALVHKHNAIVLGAWGCGVFGNDAADVARLFHMVLDEPAFKNHFKHIVFAIYRDEPKLKVFKKQFPSSIDI